MKLKTYNLQNYQIHENSTLNFHPGVNIVSGSSRNGKSALLRGLRLAFENRPGGYEYRPHNAGRAVKTISSVEFEDISIIREKSDSDSSYKLIINGETEEFKKFGQSVPDEILKALNMKDYNFQGQHDQYFLLQSTGSEIAAKLNEVAGLQIIDSTHVNINSKINSIASDIKLSEKQIKKDKEKLEELSFLDDISPLIAEIDSLIAEEKELSSDIENLEILINRIVSLQEKQDKIVEFLKVVPIYDSLKKDIDKYNELVLQSNKLGVLIDKIKSFEGSLSQYAKILTAKKSVEGLKKDIIELNDLDGSIKQLSELLDKIQKLEKFQEEINDWLEVKGESEKLRNLINEWERVNHLTGECEILCSQIVNMTKKSSYLEKLIADKKKEREDIIKNMGICVLCGSKVG